MRISRRTREEAALICQLAASQHVALADAHRWTYGPLDDGELEIWRLASKARLFAAEVLRDTVEDFSEWYWLSCLEAEALLRTGWSP